MKRNNIAKKVQMRNKESKETKMIMRKKAASIRMNMEVRKDSERSNRKKSKI